MDAALKVAFATTDMQHVDQHFGSARSFAVYGIAPDGCVLSEVFEFGELDQDGNEDKLGFKVDALKGCAVVYVQAIGSSAIRKLSSIGVQPVKVSHGSPIAELVEALQDELREGPRSWLARAIVQQKDPERFDDMEAEGWDE